MIFNPDRLSGYRYAYLRLRTICNPNRFYIFNIIEQNPGWSVSEIIDSTKISQPIVSQILAVLRKSDFIVARKVKKNIYYTTNQAEIEKAILFSMNILNKNEVRDLLLKNNYATIQTAYKYLKILLHPGRLNIIDLLYKNHEMTVDQIVQITEMKQSMVSQHFSILKNLALVVNRREGKQIFYSLDKERINSWL